MQKIILLLLSISLIGVSGCKDDDESGSFVGVWVGASVTVTDCNNPINNSTTTRSCDETRCYRLELNADGTYSFQEGLPVRTGTWTASGGLVLCVEEDGEEICETLETTVNSTTLTISSTNEANGCITTQIFSRQFGEEIDDQ
ncbi:hypothetical protein [Ekhidna sp.]|uniref:hypothetical protein n=1 Tax=Ekhidna sp. TaxID=2608089 RepID=UPI0032987316